MHGEPWFVDKILPGVVLAIIFGLFTVYVNVIGLSESTREYREATHHYRVDNDEHKLKLTDFILQNRERLIVLETKEQCCLPRLKPTEE